jgi:hypothetical protein
MVDRKGSKSCLGATQITLAQSGSVFEKSWKLAGLAILDAGVVHIPTAACRFLNPSSTREEHLGAGLGTGQLAQVMSIFCSMSILRSLLLCEATAPLPPITSRSIPQTYIPSRPTLPLGPVKREAQKLADLGSL